MRSAIVPVARADPDALGVAAGGRPARRADALHVDLGPDARLDVALREPRPWPRRRAFGGSARPSSSPGCRSTGIRTCSARGSRGRRGWGRRPSSLSGATAYAEKNWGPAFTEHWWWGQAQGFPDADACVAFAGGRRAAGVRARRPRSSCALEDARAAARAAVRAR